MSKYTYPGDFEGTFWTVTDGEFYVSTVGNDLTGDGSPKNPFLTINKAMELAADGQKIVIGPDEYIRVDGSSGNAASGVTLPCRLASTTNVNFLTGGVFTIDGVLTAVADRVLLRAQTNPAENGIYVVSAGSWQRAADFDNPENIIGGKLVPVLEGSTYAKALFQLTTAGAITVDTTALTFERASAPVVDNLGSTSTTQALSARQGAVLKGMIDTINTLLTSDDTSLDELQEIVTELKAVRATLEGMDEGGEIVALVDAAVGSAAWRVPGTYTAAISGNVTLDLSQGDVFQLTLTGHVTSFDFTNEVPGKSYVFYFMQDTTRKNLQWATGRYRFSFGNAPQLTDPTQNGSDPVAAVDIITALCPFAGRLDLVSSPNYVAN